MSENAQQFDSIVKSYLAETKTIAWSTWVPELEIRFGINKKTKPISKIDYDNVVRELMMQGWKTDNVEGVQMLRISNEVYREQRQDFIHEKDVGYHERRNLQMSGSIRTEMIGSDLIQSYCKTNSIEYLMNMGPTKDKLKFTEKASMKDNSKKPVPNIDFLDYNFRVSYKKEQDYPMQTDKMEMKSILLNWTTSKKLFRCINRVRFYHPSIPMFVDLSVLKTNNTITHKFRNKNNEMQEKTFPNYCLTVQEANLFDQPSTYEIEIELDNSRAHVDMMPQIRKCIRLVLSGLQQTPYPISYDEQEAVTKEYMSRMFDDWSGKPHPFFVGPNSVTLQQENLMEDGHLTSSVVKILDQYTVTEKADGLRSLLFVSSVGKIYMIDTNMKIKFTGAETKEKACFGSILDGEFIQQGKKKEWLNIFAAFDIYFIGERAKNADVRALDFCGDDAKTYRLDLLQNFVTSLRPQSSPGTVCKLDVRCKEFERSDSQTIFQASANVWSKRENYPYEVDGLIYTPMNIGVGGNKPGHASELKKMRWDRSFKWKPPIYNTIDFLVDEKKKDGKEWIQYNIQDDGSVCAYKTLILYCGFNTGQNAVMNPFNDVLFDTLPTFKQQSYEPQPFRPSTPYDPEAHLCYIPLERDVFGNMRMKTNPPHGPPEYFHSNMIVEFSYEKDDERLGPWKWNPIRVRYDKTARMMNKENEFGNNFETANNNWRSIHNPVTEEMITGQEMLDEGAVQDVSYYNRLERSNKTLGLRDFHNLYVKKKLIEGLARFLRLDKAIAEPILIDLAVGRAGDLQKWSLGSIRFVLGIDVSQKNIIDTRDGACMRYLNHRKTNQSSSLRALFVHGDSGMNVRSGDALSDPFSKELVRAVFGEGPNTGQKYCFDYAVAKDGFHICSCQFAVHYFFRNKTTLHRFLRNVAECTRVNGYFIGTCFDGLKVFQMLSSKQESESIPIEVDNTRIFQLTKSYSGTIKKLNADDTSIGMPIRVFQESINETHTEYLVNFEYFKRLMENYGFILDDSEAKKIGFPRASGTFDTLYDRMLDEHFQNPRIHKFQKATSMKPEEKTISFLNRYFIFKKVRNITKTTMDNIEKGEEEKEQPIPKEKTVNKLKRKITIK